MLHGAIQQFFREVAWNDLDYLIVDMPPGTGDVALSLSQTVPVVGAIVVTTPQQVSLADSRRAVRMYQKLNIPTLGIVENMSYYACTNCHHEADIFGHGGGEALATEMEVPFLGRLPIYQPIREGSDIGVPLVVAEPASPAVARVPAPSPSAPPRRCRSPRTRTAEANRGKIPLASRSADRAALRPAAAVRSQDSLDLPFTKRTLANGLDVIVHEDQHVPIVAVNVWYHVGSKNERPGRTGFAHLFEHLMFEGSEHHNTGYFPPLQQAGALLNGSTNTDRTNYWEVVPTSAVDLALWMESDRMGYLLPALTRERFETQRDVVLNERRQNYENRPYGLAMMAMTAALYPPDHPYHWMTIGAADDIRAMQLEDVQAFFRTYYHPANASLVLAGDIETARALRPGRALLRRAARRRAAGRRCTAHAALDARACGCCSRIASSCRASTWRGIRRRCSPRATPRWICWPTCSPTARRRGCTGRSSTSAHRLDVSAFQSSRELGGLLPARRHRGAGPLAVRAAAAIDQRAAAAARRRADRAARWSGRPRRPRRTSSIACRRSAASAASRIS